MKLAVIYQGVDDEQSVDDVMAWGRKWLDS
jgi:hypothetical protein